MDITDAIAEPRPTRGYKGRAGDAKIIRRLIEAATPCI